ncbi:hypothetical protein [Haloglomus salinum]|jgi:hypothetical protein|uniref:hypothetical protein n=1 Tax=Haloglomus salinum TaxID=2962673 RepID=UPI0020C96BC9|nr:hypothetical protein [Haloglomus salinum]
MLLAAVVVLAGAAGPALAATQTDDPLADQEQSVGDETTTAGETGNQTTDAADGGTGQAASGGADTAAADAGTADSPVRSIGTGALPTLPLRQVPGLYDDAPVEPEDAPYGSEGEGRLDACKLPIRQSDLPLEMAPGPSDLPVDVNLPIVPTSLLTPRNVASLGFALPPKPCTVYDFHDPSLDPTEPPTNPEAVGELNRAEFGPDGVNVAGSTLGILERDGFRGTNLAGLVANQEKVSGGNRLKITDGRTSKYVYLKGLGLVHVERRVVDGDLDLAVFGKSFKIDARCEFQNASAPSADDPLGPCQYDYTGLPELVTPERVVDLLLNGPDQPIVQPKSGGLSPSLAQD